MTMVQDRELAKPRKWTQAEQEEAQWLAEVLDGPTPMAAVMGVVGLQGSGKSLFEIWMGYKLNKYYGMPVIGDFYPKPEFIRKVNFTYIDDEKFNEEQLGMIKAAKKRNLKVKENELLESLWKNAGVSYYQAVVMWDEAYQKMDARRWLDPISIRYSYIIFQYRHYQCVLMIATPTTDLMDSKRFKKYVTHEVGCSYHANWCNTGKAVCCYSIYNRNTMKSYTLNIPVEKWIPMWDSHVMIAPRYGVLGLSEKKQ